MESKWKIIKNKQEEEIQRQNKVDTILQRGLTIVNV